jgi:hypothetical protein
MDYSKSYFNLLKFSDRIQESVSQKQMPKGLGSRVTPEQEEEPEDFPSTQSNYLNLVRQMFTPSEDQMGTEEEGWSPDLEYPTADQSASMLPPESEGLAPKRNPNYWKKASFVEGMPAEGVEPVLQALKIRESGGDYSAKNPRSTAAGAYQFIDSTWKSLTGKYGVGKEYATAKSAPPQVQEEVARRYVKEILEQNNNDVTKVPLVWYTGNPQGRISEEGLKANKGLTPQEYQHNFLRTYNKLVGKK